MSNKGTAPKSHWWQRKERIIAFAIMGTLVLIALIFVVHTYHWDLTTTTTTENTLTSQKKVTTTETGKSLLDWLQLLGVIAIPIVVGFGTAFFTRQQAKISEANTENQQQEELLRTYFDRLSELLLSKELNTSLTTHSVVRARTIATLHSLNPKRKAIVLRFLHDSGQLQYVKDSLYSLDLSHTDLNSIDLSKADLRRTDLRGADLSKANLSEADLRAANLKGANLYGATLDRADLDQAELTGAIVHAGSLQGAINVSHRIAQRIKGVQLQKKPAISENKRLLRL